MRGRIRPYNRIDRLNDEVLRLLAGMIEREVRDPRIGFATRSGVEVARDLAVAKVWFTVGEDEDPARAMDGLSSAAGYLRKRIGEELSIRTTPELRFHHDDSIDRGFKMDALLNKIAEERAGDS